MRHTHGFQNQAAGPRVQTAAANEVTPSTEPGTSSRQQAEAFLENQGIPKRKRGSDDEYTDLTNHTLDTIIARPAKRNKEFTGEYAKPNTTTTPHGDPPTGGSGDAASLMTNEVLEEIDKKKDPSTSRPDTNKCIQVGSSTFVLRTQPETPSSHHIEESISFYDSSAKPKRRPGSSTRKRMKHHHP
jgi:hypothetical protein